MGTICGAVQKLPVRPRELWCRGGPGTSHFFHQRFPAPRARWWAGDGGVLRASLLPEGCKPCWSGCWPQAGAACIWGAQATFTRLPRAPGASPQLPTGSWPVDVGGLVFSAWLWHVGPFPGTGTMGRGWILLPPTFSQ